MGVFRDLLSLNDLLVNYLRNYDRVLGAPVPGRKSTDGKMKSTQISGETEMYFFPLTYYFLHHSEVEIWGINKRNSLFYL